VLADVCSGVTPDRSRSTRPRGSRRSRCCRT